MCLLFVVDCVVFVALLSEVRFLSCDVRCNAVCCLLFVVCCFGVCCRLYVVDCSLIVVY